MTDTSKAEEAAAKVKLQKTKDWTKRVILVSVIVAMVVMLMSVVETMNPGTLPLGSYREVTEEEVAEDGTTVITTTYTDYNDVLRPAFIDGIVLAIMAMIGPYGFYYSAKMKKIHKIERYLPDFLRDVAEAGRFGMTLAEAIVVAAAGKYGNLTPEIKKMAAQIEWGVPASEALRLFGTRVNTTLTHRTIAIVTKSSDAGGEVSDVLTMVAHAVKEEQLTKAEKSIQMVTYLAVIYIAYMVFLITILIMSGTFLPAMEDAGASIASMSEESGAEVDLINVDVVPALGLLFFLAAIIHGMGDGLVAGLLETGHIQGGLRHSFLLLMIGYMMLR
ncbi:MAG: type II secretion system F family protein [Thermoplasmata archaeon]|nr:type II secretion system F family protein [Thermoplasmata archaeon]